MIDSAYTIKARPAGFGREVHVVEYMGDILETTDTEYKAQIAAITHQMREKK